MRTIHVKRLIQRRARYSAMGKTMMAKAKTFLMTCALAFAGGAAFMGNPIAAQNSKLAVFGALDKGEWTVRFRDGSATRKVCLRSGQELMQLRHGRQGCKQVVVTNDAQEATVQYSCRGDGYGRTTVRRETRSLVQLSSQGFADGRPFEFFAEARRTGNCS